jgi:purine nucleoside permease
MPPPGKTAAANLAGDTVDGYSAYIPSLEAAHRVGSRVVHALVDGWKDFENAPPSAPAP